MWVEAIAQHLLALMQRCVVEGVGIEAAAGGGRRRWRRRRRLLLRLAQHLHLLRLRLLPLLLLHRLLLLHPATPAPSVQTHPRFSEGVAR